MPNEASYAFHLSLGFEPIGLFPRIGRKFDRWHDVAWLYRPVRLNRE
jgi:L-amino acid N-acyltransferase YncA